MIIIQGNKGKYWVGILAAIFLGVTFLVAGSSKLFTPEVDIEVPEVLLILLVVMELAIGLLLVAGILVKAVASVSLLLTAGFITSNILMKISGQEECLSCFGGLGKLSTSQALFFDGVMAALAVTILVFYPSRFFNKRPWYWGEG